VSGYVLSAPSAEDRERIDASISEAISALPLLLAGDDVKAMTRLHSFSAA
jgi:PTH1 family peptidyl-tRNA hydrolase